MAQLQRGSTSCRCRTSGSIPGSPPGTWPSTGGPGPPRPGVRQVPARSSLCREWFQHPKGALPAYEWDFGDVNPPVHAWAALQVFAIDGARDLDFLSRIFDKLLVNFTWWVNREDANGRQRLRGRLPRASTTSARSTAPHLPGGRHPRAVRRHRLDGARTRSAMGDDRGRAALAPGSAGHDLVLKFLEHFAVIRDGHGRRIGVWDEDGRALLRPAVTPDRDSRAGQGPLHGRDHPAVRRRGRSTSDILQRALRRMGKRFTDAAVRRRAPSARPATEAQQLAATRRPAAAARRGRDRPAEPAVRHAVRRGRVPVAATGCGRCRPTTAITRTSSTSRASGHDRLRAGRVDDVDVRWQLELARPDLDAPQLPPGRRRSSATTGSTATTTTSSTRRDREATDPRQGRRRPPGTG